MAGPAVFGEGFWEADGFDRRRHGMIMGMGAVGLVLERAEDAAARGCAPIAELLATVVANSAYHGTRLDRDHIAACFTQLVEQAAAEENREREELNREPDHRLSKRNWRSLLATASKNPSSVAREHRSSCPRSVPR